MIKIGIRKELGDFSLEISLRIEKGEFVALTGKSGSGKTTLLRILAGLEKASGAIEVEGVKWLDKKVFVPPQKRAIGFVFQEYALFPNMSVEQNLLYVAKDRALAYHLLKIVDLLELKSRYPHTLSGGQKQRVALARALMKRPKLLLLDEPLSALDASMRSFLQTKIKELHNEFGTTTIMVSHDIAEIYRLATRVVELERGKVIADTSKERLLDKRTIFKAEVVDIQDNKMFVGFMGNIFDLSRRKEAQIGDIVDIVIEDVGLYGV